MTDTAPYGYSLWPTVSTNCSIATFKRSSAKAIRRAADHTGLDVIIVRDGKIAALHELLDSAAVDTGRGGWRRSGIGC